MKEKRGDVNRHPDNLFALIFIHVNDDVLLGGSRGLQRLPGRLERSLPKLSLTKGNESLRSLLIVPHRMDFSQGSFYDYDCTPAAGYAPHLPQTLGACELSGNWEAPGSLGSFHPSLSLAIFSFQPPLLRRAVQLPDPQRRREREKAEIPGKTAQVASPLPHPDCAQRQGQSLSTQ